MKDVIFTEPPQDNEQSDIYSDSSMIPEPPVPEGKPKKKKKRFRLLRALIKTVIALFIIITLVISAIAFSSGYSSENLKSNKYISKSSLANNPFITNILLIGIDDEAESTSRSDSMILLSLDYVHRKIKMTSFLRDSWVEIPSKSSNHKLNASYAYGGAQLVVDTLEYNFKVDIDHYVKVDFEMFTKAIDKIGGIDIEVTDTEANFINKTTRYTVSSGESVHLSGNTALVYSRIRKLDSDYMRTYRQRKVITAIIDKLKHKSLKEIYELSREILPLLETDLNPLEISFNAYKGGIAALLFDIEQIRIPTEELMYADYRNGQWVEILDLEGCVKQIYEFIYKASPEKE